MKGSGMIEMKKIIKKLIEYVRNGDPYSIMVYADNEVEVLVLYVMLLVCIFTILFISALVIGACICLVFFSIYKELKWV